MGKEQDITITQDPKIAVIIAKALKDHDGPVTINLNMNASINTSGITSQIDDESLIAFIESFPEPRLRNFMSHVFGLIQKKFPVKMEGARWLGADHRTVYRGGSR